MLGSFPFSCIIWFVSLETFWFSEANDNCNIVFFLFNESRASHGLATSLYKSRDLMRESLRLYHMAYSMKRIEIPLSHIRNKNKFKSRDSLFPLVQCFKTIFLFLHFLFNVLRLQFVSFDSMFQDFSISLTHTKNYLHFHSPFSLLLLYIHILTALHAITSQIH